jgi:uncharacterized protein YnzC (UPF0291/DUF896 family)
MIEEVIKRINELSKKEKEIGLSTEEKEEQQNLRQEYLKNFRSHFKSHLNNIKVVDEKGKDVTPQKLKDAQNKNQDKIKTPVQ